MPSGIIIIDKPTGWTSMDVCLPSGRSAPAGGPIGSNMLGRSEFALRRDFGSAKMLVPARSRRSLALGGTYAERNHHH